jgi:hypothetical protein
VLNRSDDLDSEDVESIREQNQTHLTRELGISPEWFTVSARWEMADAEARNEIVQMRRRQGYYAEEPLHEWPDLLAYLTSRAAERSAAHEGAYAELHAVCNLVVAVQRAYDQRAQAESVFLQAWPHLQAHMPPPLGPRYLEQAVKAVEAGRPVPWQVLANFGVSPAHLAPEMALTEGLLIQLFERLLVPASELARSAYNQYTGASLERLRSQLEAVARECPTLSPGYTALLQQIDWWEWCVGCLAPHFDYDSAYQTLVERWSREPDQIAADTRFVREYLAAALADA